MRVRRKQDDGYLAHHGVKGQRWGVRRYQNADGTLTSAGRQRYLKSFNNRDYVSQRGVASEFVKSTGLSNSDKIIDSKKSYDKETKLMTEAQKLSQEDWEKEKSDFSDLVKKSSISKQKTVEDYTLAQKYCINRGVNPYEYAKTVNNAHKKYINSVRDEVERIIGNAADNYKLYDFPYSDNAQRITTDVIMKINNGERYYAFTEVNLGYGLVDKYGDKVNETRLYKNAEELIKTAKSK